MLVIRRRYIGDIVLLGPVFANLRRHWPEARLAALVESAYAPLLRLNPDVDQTLELPRRTGEWPGFVSRLRRERFTHVLDLDNNDRTALVSRLTGAASRIALHHEDLRWGPLYTAVVNDPGELHENRSIVEYYLSALRPTGVPVVTREVRLVPREADLAAARRLVPPGGRRLLVHPGTRSPWRLWPAEKYAAVIDSLQDDRGVSVFLTGGPRDQPVVEAIRAAARTHVVAIPGPPLPEFAALAAQFPWMLCHDSGPMHIAAAVGTRVVALLGSQNPVVFAPPGPGHILLQPPLPCTTCVSPGECQPGDSYNNRCVQNIPVDQVLAALRKAYH